MTASQLAVHIGLDSLSQMESITGVKRRTLENWVKTDKIQQFVFLAHGCVAYLRRPILTTEAIIELY